MGGGVRFVHFLYLAPFPVRSARAALKGVRRVVVVENSSTGQIGGLLREHLGVEPEGAILKYDGRPFYPHEIAEGLAGLS